MGRNLRLPHIPARHLYSENLRAASAIMAAQPDLQWSIERHMRFRRRTPGRRIRRLTAQLRLLTLLGIAFALAGCTSLFLVPDRIERIRPERLNIAYDDVWLQSVDGVRVHAWHLKAKGPRRGTVLFFHGNAQNISAHIASVYWLPEQGFDVFMPDPRGYGRSQGTANVAGAHLDAQAALEHVVASACGEIIVFGQSLGGAMAVHTAASTEHAQCLRGVIVEGAFSSYRSIAREKLDELWLTWALQWPLSFLFSDAYSPLASVARISPTQLLIVHGEADVVIPPQHARRLYAAASEPKQLWLLPGTKHIGATLDAGYRQRMVDWMLRALSADKPRRHQTQ